MARQGAREIDLERRVDESGEVEVKMYICVCKLLSKAQMSVELILEVCVIRHCDIVCRIIDMLLNICYSLLSSRTFHTVIVISLKYHVNVRHYQLSEEESSSHSPYKPPPPGTQIVTHRS